MGRLFSLFVIALFMGILMLSMHDGMQPVPTALVDGRQ